MHVSFDCVSHDSIIMLKPAHEVTSEKKSGVFWNSDLKDYVKVALIFQ